MNAPKDDLTRAASEALVSVRRNAQSHAVTARAQGHERERDWLDLLHLLDRAERDLAAVFDTVGVPAQVDEAGWRDRQGDIWREGRDGWAVMSADRDALIPSTDEIRYRVEHDWEPYGDESFDRWLAEHDEAVRADERAKHGERVAVAIEGYLNDDDCDNDPECESCGLVRHLAIIARSVGATS